MPNRWKEFGDLLRETRLGQPVPMSQDDLGEKVHRSLSTVCRWEKGDRRPRQPELLQLAIILGVPVQVLQKKAGYTPEFDWIISFHTPPQSQPDILSTATPNEIEELTEYLKYLRFRASVMKIKKPHSANA